ncbi:hypothetical protein SMMN14_09357 [Sphaerulina musiva]
MNEDDIAVMMADLGHQRRDAVVAPEDGKRQGPFMDERDKMLDAAEELMLRQKKLRGPAQNEKHEKLQKWNTPAIFGKDDIAEQQPDRYHGQGHRAYLAEKVLQYNRTPDGGGGNRGGRGGGSIRGKGNMPQHHGPPPPAPDRSGTASKPGPKRARSPRSAGTMRFVKGKLMPNATRDPAPGPATRALQQVTASPARATAAGHSTLRDTPSDQADKGYAQMSQIRASHTISASSIESAGPASAEAKLIANTPTAKPREAAFTPAVPRSAVLSKGAPGINGVSDQAGKRATMPPMPAELRAIAAAETPEHKGAGLDVELVNVGNREVPGDSARLGQNPGSENASAYCSAHKARVWLLQLAVDALNGGVSRLAIAMADEII